MTHGQRNIKSTFCFCNSWGLQFPSPAIWQLNFPSSEPTTGSLFSCCLQRNWHGIVIGCAKLGEHNPQIYHTSARKPSINHVYVLAKFSIQNNYSVSCCVLPNCVFCSSNSRLCTAYYKCQQESL